MKTSLMMIAAVLSVSSANAQMKPSEINTATGIAQIIARADKCGYEVNKDALSAYYRNKGLATPEALAWVSRKITIELGDIDAVTPAECEITKATAREIGVTS